MLQKIIDVILLFLCLNSVFGDEVKSVSVKEGHSVTLHTDLTELQSQDDIEWMFGVQSPDEIIATFYRKDNITSLNKERFRNHVEIDDQTGSLIITNITTQHTGLYKLEITRKPSSHIRHFNLTVYAGLSVPVISRVSSQCSSSSSSSCCCVLCSVMNVSHDVSVSWYKGKSLLSSISVSDLNIRLSLPLEVEYQDTNTYRCVVNNPITNLTQHLHINQLCQKCEVPTAVHFIHKVVISCAVVGCVMILTAVLIFWIRRKHTNTQQQTVQTREEEIAYAEPTFFKRQTHKPKCALEDDVVYAGVMRR
ncbi:natural killer cell receptor 2B4-like [Triplophysa dalaica]|uniref:natural killer cell receptor 2B4-like n=1 Tax=Triplophysa dalaica TaxID=1582913 RepID=UPI0024DF8023|nr:natural killer cell receptor 2B4-like [Triplophysa dalaica]